MTYSAIKIANRLLEIAEESNGEIDPLKLIKLVYISHGWSFPVLGRALINDRIEAWQYGPVIPKLYHAIKKYRADPVTEKIEGDRDSSRISKEDDDLLREVYSVYGKFSGGQLSNLTHKSGTPWDVTWNENGKNSEISNDLIKQHYGRLAAR
ncbi:Panacea domain-containing protein [Azospirillum sp. B4]|uniref:Panacea domain-containing protein n=1 Tax=Azospirillum sp. B4 TaxID=95605 RepID=UPI000A00377A|nr:type II toxin-antitoxin system antitoxin SocA domain-containing protein [Azospirillum sp. B4]